ncbi:MAG: endonuclease [Phycisphaeraceae bacterium]|nr:MAG: endonuclease [Phycisphaeraceae bacterium]
MPETPVIPRTLLTLAFLALATLASPAAAEGTAIRVATFNAEDIRTADLLTGDNPRLKAIAEIIQRIRPNVLLLNEIAYDEPGVTDVPEGAPAGSNADRFVERYLSVPQAPGLRPIRFDTFMRRSNTGLHSGHDLDRSGAVVNTYPPPPGAQPDGSPGRQTADGRAYGGDSWGFGTFPGQYAMALLVDERLEILADDARTFRLMPWSYMPNAMLPMTAPEGDADPEPWFGAEAQGAVRLSSKSHWDVPIRLPSGAVIHALCAHPTPPAFDGPEGRNKRRNHDEIRFWADYLAGAAYVVDDTSTAGGLVPAAHFVILGDLNADPDEGSSLHDPIGLLLSSPRVRHDPAPTSDIEIEGLDPDDTARFRLRVDYVIPSTGLTPTRSGVWRQPPADRPFPTDHFPVWVDLVVPDPG